MSTAQEPTTGAARAKVECVECGSPYINERQATRLQERLGLTDDIIQRCPRCRKNKLVHDLEERFTSGRMDSVG